MKEIKRKWDNLSKERRKKCIDEIITFFQTKRGEKIGIIAAEEVLDFFLESLGDVLYAKGVEDSKELLKGRFEDFQVDLDLLIGGK